MIAARDEDFHSKLDEILFYVNKSEDLRNEFEEIIAEYITHQKTSQIFQNSEKRREVLRELLVLQHELEKAISAIKSYPYQVYSKQTKDLPSPLDMGKNSDRDAFTRIYAHHALEQNTEKVAPYIERLCTIKDQTIAYRNEIKDDPNKFSYLDMENILQWVDQQSIELQYELEKYL